MQLLDSRRLTGPNLLWDRPGAVIDVAFGDVPPSLVIGAWESEARRLLDEVGWKEERLCVRRFEGGASLAISAPVDALYAATEINDSAWDAARDLLAGSHRQLLQRVARQLREEIRDEERPRLRRLLDAAMAHDVSAVLDTETVSLGLGKHSRCWPLADVPHPDDVDWPSLSRIPVALVTGTNGKTTTVRMMAAIGRAAGLATGVSCTDWLAMDGEVIARDDYAGPEGARKILRHPRCELAILETARGGLLRRGLAVERADAALITNVASDHIGEFGVQNLEELADVKWVVTRALAAHGCLVLNADDPRLVARAPEVSCRIIWFSDNPKNPALRSHAGSGGSVCTLDRGRIVLRHGERLEPVVRVDRIPLCFGGAAQHNVANALAATALAHGLGLPGDAIKRGLVSMQAGDNPGRANLYTLGRVQVLLDFAHNPHGLLAAVGMAARLKARRRLLVIGQAGDRSDADIRDLAAATLGLRFDRIIIKRLEKYSRGRAPGEAAALLREEFLRHGYRPRELGTSRTETAALRNALRWAQAGDLVVYLAHEDRDGITAMLERLQGQAS
jgi:cyanophycin synthetase